MPAHICNWHRFSVLAVVAFQSKTGASTVSPNNIPPGVTSQGQMREKIKNPTINTARDIKIPVPSQNFIFCGSEFKASDIVYLLLLKMAIYPSLYT
jgi:hypothetical protein